MLNKTEFYDTVVYFSFNFVQIVFHG